MDQQKPMMKMSWARFAAMIATSTVVMFFLMYHLIYSLDHATFSLTRLIAALMMGAVMAVIMLAYMWSMYPGRTAKVGVLLAASVMALGLFALNRSQALIGDVAFMQAMIPHHSIAINNAEKAKLSDPRVRRLADEIISGQVREITEMKLLIADIEAHGERGQAALPARPAQLTPDMKPQIDEALK